MGLIYSYVCRVNTISLNKVSSLDGLKELIIILLENLKFIVFHLAFSHQILSQFNRNCSKDDLIILIEINLYK